MTKLGVALLGLDHWYAALDLAPAIAASETVRLVSVSHDDGAKAEKVAHDYGAELATTDYRAALDRPDVQIVVSLYSTDRNPAICREAAALGKHIVSVKPIACTLEDADAIVAAVAAAGVHAFSLDCLGRLTAERLRLKQWIDEGRIGTPQRLTQTLHGSLPMPWPGQDGPSWWTDPARVPGGGWIDHAIYAVDTVRWLFGSEPVGVSGVSFNMRYPDLGVEDYGAATFTLANGAVALIEDTWASDRGFGVYRQEIVGSAGAIMEEGIGTGRTHIRGDFGHAGWLTVGSAHGSRITPVEHVAACVRGEAEPVATIADGRANLAACLAFYQAAKEGTTKAI